MNLGNKKIPVYDPAFLRRGEILFRRLEGCSQVDANHFGNYAGYCKRRGCHLVFEIQFGDVPKYVPFDEFAKGHNVFSEIVPDLDSQEAIRRMEEVFSKGLKYDFLLQNCEHLARYVAAGKGESPQIQSLATVAVLSIAFLILSRN